MSGRGRSSFRGNSYRGSSNYRGGGSGYRGTNSYSERGGYSTNSSRGGRYASNNSYSSGGGYQESRSRYPSNSEKFNSRGRDDSYNRRSSYRPEESYSGSRRGSPDRKRMRTDQGSSGRRSNEGYGAGGDGYGNQRYENSSYVERRYSSERHGRSPKEFRPTRNEGSLYSKPADSSAMPPPRTRGSFRGRMSSRGVRGRRVIRRDPYARKNITIMLPSRRVRNIDYARRLKIQKLRSSVRKRESSSNESEKDWDAGTDDQKKKRKSDEKEGSSTPTKKKSPKKEKTEKKEESQDAGDDKEKAESGDEQPAEESGKDDDEDQEKTEKELPKSRFTGLSFIKLTCVHCASKCVTFKEYLLHLRGTRHSMAMSRVAQQQKQQLSKMRAHQRNNQRELDEKNKDDNYIRTQFCPLCKLNYRQMKSKHQASEAHREIKKFLLPYCRTCRLSFRSPMRYESHICSLEHIKRKARVDYLRSKKGAEIEDAGSDEGVKELDLDNFMTLDSVGDVDDEEDEEEADADKNDTEKTTKKKKTEINVGSEHVRKVEVYYCELCKMYLPRHEEPESALKKHCRIRTHLQRYVSHRDDRELRKQAEKMHRKREEAKEAKEAKEKSDESANISTTSTPKKEKDKESNGALDTSKTDSVSNAIENGSLDEEDAVDDKLWADVDKDLGDILREVEPNKSSDDEDDSRTTSVRYDRFRYSDKKTAGDEKAAIKLDDSEIAEEEEEETTAPVKSEPVNVEEK